MKKLVITLMAGAALLFFASPMLAADDMKKSTELPATKMVTGNVTEPVGSTEAGPASEYKGSGKSEELPASDLVKGNITEPEGMEATAAGTMDKAATEMESEAKSIELPASEMVKGNIAK